MNIGVPIVVGVVGVLVAEVIKAYYKIGNGQKFKMMVLSKMGIKYERCSCHNGLEQILGESFGTYGPEFHTYPCRRCNGNLYAKKKEK